MVTPINSEKALNLNPERSAQTKQATSSETLQSGKKPLQNQAPGTTEASPEIDSAQQLYQSENSRAAASNHVITTPEQARSVLDQFLQQLTGSPEQALQAQANGRQAMLENLLSHAPA